MHTRIRLRFTCHEFVPLSRTVYEVTVSANDGSPELAACVRRGPFAVPDENETIEYLLSRKRVSRASTEQHSVFHVSPLPLLSTLLFVSVASVPCGHC